MTLYDLMNAIILPDNVEIRIMNSDVDKQYATDEIKSDTSNKDSVEKIIIPPVQMDAKSNCRYYVDCLIHQTGINLTEAVKLINEKFPEDKTTYQNFLNKVLRGTLRDYELAQLADVCGYQLCMIPKDREK